MVPSRKKRTPSSNGRKVKNPEAAARPYMKEIRVRGFKSLRDVTMRPGRLNILIGTNASGKSNFVEVLRILNGLGQGLSVDEIFNQPAGQVGFTPWEPIRGGTANAVFKSKRGIKTKGGNGSFNLDIIFGGFPRGDYGYHVELDVGHKRIVNEHGDVAGKNIWIVKQQQSSHMGLKKTELKSFLPALLDSIPIINNDIEHSSLNSIDRFLKSGVWKKTNELLSKKEDFFDSILEIIKAVQILDPNSNIVKSYSKKRAVSKLGKGGENFAAVVDSIPKENKSEYESWLRELTPREFDGVEVLKGASDDLLFAVKENGIIYPADTLSDGTLRFAALAAALFQEPMPSVMAIEEIENGVHPTRLRLLVELLRAMSKESQVFATTHSPLVLAWLKPEEYASTFIFKRNEKDGSTQVKALTELPDFSKIIKKRSIIDLALEGWPEIAF